jgi:Uma2 family endonuclease
VSAVPNDSHGQTVDTIHMRFTGYGLDHPGLIRRVSGASGVEIVIHDSHTTRHPDLAVVFRGKAPNSRGRRMPDLVVEVVSAWKRSRDRIYVAKREDYLAFGILEYWIVDPFERRVTILSRADAGLGWSERVFDGEDAIVSLLLPGFDAEVGTLWAEAGDARREAAVAAL